MSYEKLNKCNTALGADRDKSCLGSMEVAGG